MIGPAFGTGSGSVLPAAPAQGAVSAAGPHSLGPAMPAGAPCSPAAGFGAVHAALISMNNAVGLRRDGQALWGWEELDFETLRR